MDDRTNIYGETPIRYTEGTGKSRKGKEKNYPRNRCTGKKDIKRIQKEQQIINWVITFTLTCDMIVICLFLIQLHLFRNEAIYEEFICEIQCQLGEI